MAKTASPPKTIIIKKYANRRLYNTYTSCYVTLENLTELVKDEVDFEVRDAKSGEDLTRSVLTQIIFEQEAKGQGMMPTGFLRKLIGFYGKGVQPMLPTWLEMSMNSFASSQEKWRSSLNKNFTLSPIELFEEQAKRNMVMFEKAMSMMTPGVSSSKSKNPAKNGKIQTAPREMTDSLSLMRAQMSAMQEQIDTLIKQTET